MAKDKIIVKETPSELSTRGGKLFDKDKINPPETGSDTLTKGL